VRGANGAFTLSPINRLFYFSLPNSYFLCEDVRPDEVAMLAALAIEHFNGSSKCNGYRVSWTLRLAKRKSFVTDRALGEQICIR